MFIAPFLCRQPRDCHMHQENIHQLFYFSTFRKKKGEGDLYFTPLEFVNRPFFGFYVPS